MASFNRVIIMGNLTRDPDYKQLASGQSVCRLGLASNRQFKNRQTGMMVQEVCFVDIDVWGPQADSCNQYLQKGRPILVEGRLKLDSWIDNEGQKRSKHSIVADRVTFLSGATQAEEGEAFADSASRRAQQESQEPSSYAKASEDTSFKADKPASEDVSVQAEKPVKSKKKVKQDSEQITATGEIGFKDEEPFEDDLPF